MIDLTKLTGTVEKAIENTDIFVVDITVGNNNNIVVELDSDTSIDIDTCAKVTRAIETNFDRDVEDYDLEVGSSGLTSPFKVRRQYEKNLGNEIEVLTKDGRKLSGILTKVETESYTIEVPVKKKIEGKKRPIIEDEPVEIPYSITKTAKYKITF